MKSSHRLSVLLPVALLLVSCVNAASNESSLSTDNPISGNSNSSAEAVDLASFLAKLAANNCTLSLSGAGAATISFYGDQGFYAEFDGSSQPSGVLVNKNQGIFDFTYVDGAVLLGQAESNSTKINEIFYTPSDLAAASGDFSPSGKNVYDVKMTDGYYVDVAYAIIGLSQIDPAYLDYGFVSDLKLTIDEDGNGASFTFSITEDEQVYEFATDVNQIGTTSNTAFSAYLASPSDVPARTAYTAESATAIKQIFGESVTVPFPDGLASALFRDDLAYDDEGFLQGVTFQEFGSDISTSFINQLLADGFQSITNSDFSGTYLTYEKSYQLESETVGPSVISFQVAYDADSDITSGSVSSYTYPKSFEGTDFSKTNEILNAYNGATAAIPLLPTSSDFSKVLGLDSSYIEDVALSLEVDISVSAYETCIAYAKAYMSLLTAAGFTVQYGDLETDGYTSYGKGQVSVALALWYNDNDAFDGGFSFFFSDSSPKA